MLSDRDNDSHNAINPFLGLQSNDRAHDVPASLTVNYRLMERRRGKVFAVISRRAAVPPLPARRIHRCRCSAAIRTVDLVLTGFICELEF